MTRRVGICPSCKQEIDPETCWCGGHIDKHTMGDGHAPVPMGCVCHYADSREDIEEKPDPETDPYFIDREIGRRENWRGWE